MKTVYLIHGWGGSPDEPLHKWLRKELVSKDYGVVAPTMPEPEEPKITTWVAKLREVVGQPNENTILVGHSIGCQTILRYLESLRPTDRVGGVVFIAPWFTLQNLESEEEWEIAKPWTDTPTDFAKVLEHVPGITAIFSDNDPVVPFENANEFQKELGTENIIEQKKGHFTEEDGVTELSSALEAILKI